MMLRTSCNVLLLRTVNITLKRLATILWEQGDNSGPPPGIVVFGLPNYNAEICISVARKCGL